MTVWNQLEPMLFLAPQPLSILSRGLSDGAGAQYTVFLHWMWVTPHPITAADTDLMQSLVRIDFTKVVAILLSFLAIWIPLALAFVVALLILLANPDVTFTGDDWFRLIGLFSDLLPVSWQGFRPESCRVSLWS